MLLAQPTTVSDLVLCASLASCVCFLLVLHKNSSNICLTDSHVCRQTGRLTRIPQASWQVSFDAVQLSLLERTETARLLDTGIETHKIRQQKFDVDPI